MSVDIVLGLLFLSITFVVFSVLRGTTEAVESHSTELASSTDVQLRKLFLFANTRRLVVIYILCLIAVPVALWLLGMGVPIIVLGVLMVVAAPRFILKRMAAHRRMAINQALPDALAQIAGAMRAGATFTSALQSMVDEQKGPLGQEFGLMLREQRVGARLEEALDNLGERVQSEEMDLVISAAVIAQEVGGNLAEILQRLSETLRRKLEMEGKVRALTSQGVLQGYVVTALPFVILGMLFLIETEATRPMFYSLLGWCFLTVMLVLQFIGGLVIRKIVSIDI